MSGPLLALLPVGIGVGFIGSLIGVGGGFFVVPFLLLAYGFTPEAATAASLATVFLSACSATVANARQRRIDWRTGWAMAAGSVPGAFLGRLLVERLSPGAFAWVFAALLAGVAAYLAFVRLREGRGLLRGAPREIRDSDGQAHRYEMNLVVAVAVSLGVGTIASLFGIGGGLLLVPFLVIVFGAPILVATSTAQFVFVFTSLAGLGEAVRRGQFPEEGLAMVAVLGLGVVVGAQLGVAAAKRVRARLVRGVLSAVLLAVAALLVLREWA